MSFSYVFAFASLSFLLVFLIRIGSVEQILQRLEIGRHFLILINNPNFLLPQLVLTPGHFKTMQCMSFDMNIQFLRIRSFPLHSIDVFHSLLVRYFYYILLSAALRLNRRILLPALFIFHHFIISQENIALKKYFPIVSLRASISERQVKRAY